jgi:hypothetical protein
VPRCWPPVLAQRPFFDAGPATAPDASSAGLYALTQWSRELTTAVEHPYNPGLMLEPTAVRQTGAGCQVIHSEVCTWVQGHAVLTVKPINSRHELYAASAQPRPRTKPAPTSARPSVVQLAIKKSCTLCVHSLV